MGGEGGSAAGRAYVVTALLLRGRRGGAPAFAGIVVEKDKLAVPALVPDRQLQGAPRLWILREEILRAALLEVEHQKARAHVGELTTVEKGRQRPSEMRQ